MSANGIAIHPPTDWVESLRAYEAFLRLRDLSPQTIALRVYHMRMLGHALQKPIFDVTLDDLTTFLGTRAWSNSTQSAVRSSITVFYGWAAKTGRVAKSPAADLPRVKQPTPKPKPVPEDALATAMEAASDPGVRLAIRVSASLGLRRAEVAQLHVDDLIRTEHGTLLRVLGKGRKERVVPVGADLAAAITDHIAAHGRDGWAFPAPGEGHITPHWLGTLVSRALPDGYTMHKLRHRALTQAYRSSKDILLTAALAGHSSVSTTQQYYVAPDYTALRSLVEGISR